MEILPDILSSNLKIVFCGMAAGTRAAKLNAYYAGIGNKFWSTLWDFGFIQDKIAPCEFRKLVGSGIGLTDLVKDRSGNDSAIVPTSNDIRTLKDKIELYKPAILGFNGKTSAKYFLGHYNIDYGFQKECIGSTKIYVLPSTSLYAMQYWDEDYWIELARIVGSSST